MRCLLSMIGCSLALGACAGEEFSGDQGGGAGSTPSVPCNEDPWTCPSGQVCWIDNAQGYSCLNVGPGEVGDNCDAVINVPHCGAGLACFRQAGDSQGRCTPYCDPTDPAKACPDNAPCVTATFADIAGTIQLCDLD